MIEALENPSWLKLGASDEEKQAAEKMEEMITLRQKTRLYPGVEQALTGQPSRGVRRFTAFSKWRKDDREKFSVLTREVEGAIGKFHGVENPGDVSKPNILARNIAAHLREAVKWANIHPEGLRMPLEPAPLEQAEGDRPEDVSQRQMGQVENWRIEPPLPR